MNSARSTGTRAVTIITGIVVTTGMGIAGMVKGTGGIAIAGPSGGTVIRSASAVNRHALASLLQGFEAPAFGRGFLHLGSVDKGKEENYTADVGAPAKIV